MKQPNDRIHCKSRNQASSEEVTAVQQLLTNILCTTPLSVFNGSYTDPKFIRAYCGFREPCTVIEYMMLRCFDSLQSIV